MICWPPTFRASTPIKKTLTQPLSLGTVVSDLKTLVPLNRGKSHVAVPSYLMYAPVLQTNFKDTLVRARNANVKGWVKALGLPASASTDIGGSKGLENTVTCESVLTRYFDPDPSGDYVKRCLGVKSIRDWLSRRDERSVKLYIVTGLKVARKLQFNSSSAIELHAEAKGNLTEPNTNAIDVGVDANAGDKSTKDLEFEVDDIVLGIGFNGYSCKRPWFGGQRSTQDNGILDGNMQDNQQEAVQHQEIEFELLPIPEEAAVKETAAMEGEIQHIGAEVAMTDVFSIYRHANELAYSKLPPSTHGDLPPSHDLDENAIKRENAQEFLRFELAILEISGAQERLEAYAATKEYLIRDEAEEQPLQEEDPVWTEIQDGVKDQVITVGSKIQDTGICRSDEPKDNHVDDLIQRVAQHTESVANTGVVNKGFMPALLPFTSSAWGWMDYVRRKAALNVTIAGWIFRHSAPACDGKKGYTEGSKQAELMDALYRLLASHQCSEKDHKILLELSDWSKFQEEETAFHMFLFSCHDGSWQRTICHFKRRETGTALNLCDGLHRAWCLKAVLDSDLEIHTVGLESLLIGGKLTNNNLVDNIGKFRLALRLGSALHLLVFSPWLQQELDSCSVHIIRNEVGDQTQMLDKTFISCQIPSKWNETSIKVAPDLELHSKEYLPKCFLSFAQLLVDIANGMKSQPPETEEDWHYRLLEEVQNNSRDLFMSEYWKAVRGCMLFRELYDNYLSCYPATEKREMIRAAQHVIYKHIVSPLRKHLSTWEQEKRDQKLASKKSERQNLELFESEQAVVVDRLKHLPMAKRQKTEGFEARKRAEYKFSLWLQQDDHFTEIEKPIHDPNPLGFVGRMKLFQDVFINRLPKPRPVEGIDGPVRVAVLDTGFHVEKSTMYDEGDEFLSDPIVSQRVKEQKNFFSREAKEPNEKDTEDIHGHGTLVARLVLQFAPRAEVYVARITDSKTLRMTTTAQLVEALKWAGEKADIINLSFSLGKMPDPELAEVIEDLVDCHQKLIFAAASNEGSYGTRMWPAKAPGVFAIHATNDLGQLDTALNPGKESDRDNFAVLGSQIESYWAGKHISISGTSFASPVAAAIAANVLEIARRTEGLPESSKRGLNRYGAMRDLFRNHMSQNNANGADHVIIPWKTGSWDQETQPEKIVETIRKSRSEAEASSGSFDSGQQDTYSRALECKILFHQYSAISTPYSEEIFKYQQRFLIWTSFLGVFTTESASLDRRLESNPEIKKPVVAMLQVLRRNLERALNRHASTFLRSKVEEDGSMYGITGRHRMLWSRRHSKKLSQERDEEKETKAVKTETSTAAKTASGNSVTTSSPRRRLDIESQAKTVYSATVPSERPIRVHQIKEESKKDDVSSARSSNPPPRAQYPELPQALSRKCQASCPYCLRHIEISDNPGKARKDWIAHLNTDLRPYVCVSEACKNFPIAFATPKEWEAHMENTHGAEWARDIHRVRWYCESCGDKAGPFSSEDFLACHLKETSIPGHKKSIDELEIERIKSTHKKIYRRKLNSCPLCNWPNEDKTSVPAEERGISSLPKHFARHLQQLALLSISWWKQDIGEADDDIFHGTASPIGQNSEIDPREKTETNSAFYLNGNALVELEKNRQSAELKGQESYMALQIQQQYPELITGDVVEPPDALPGGVTLSDLETHSFGLKSDDNSALNAMIEIRTSIQDTLPSLELLEVPRYDNTDFCETIRKAFSQPDSAVPTNGLDNTLIVEFTQAFFDHLVDSVDSVNDEDKEQVIRYCSNEVLNPRVYYFEDTKQEKLASRERLFAILSLAQIPAKIVFFIRLGISDIDLPFHSVSFAPPSCQSRSGKKIPLPGDLSRDRLKSLISSQKVICRSDKPMAISNTYSVGWICASSIELVAAQKLLDAEETRSIDIPANDNNYYTLGMIGGHHIVIGALPHGQYGVSSATAVIKDMLRTFLNIKFVLLVGVGGGVPTRHDIRRGDVVVACPSSSYGGVIQYDYEDEDNPMIHHGLIASGNQVMKDAITRDRLSAQYDVLCFEMEAAGLMNHVPCGVIRGICDYSDSHKDRQWIGYAAMMAAAYAKELLLEIRPAEVTNSKKLADLLDGS
ncbi:thermostable alkaline protease [Fusarium bulbicola]|nr:thermostable alkaline protease [Fusarium bulbicola]